MASRRQRLDIFEVLEELCQSIILHPMMIAFKNEDIIQIFSDIHSFISPLNSLEPPIEY